MMTMRMRSALFAFITTLALCIIATAAQAQNPAVVVRFGAADPALCKPAGPNIFLNTTSGLLKFCSAANTWASAGGGSVPVTYSGATATNDILTLQTTDDNVTKSLLRLKSSNGLSIGLWGPTGILTPQSNAVNIALLQAYTPAPSAPSAALAGAGAGNIDNGTHVYQEQCVTSAGDSMPSASSGSVNVADKTVNGKVTVTLVACPAGSTGRDLFRSKANTATPLFLVATSPVVADPLATTTYTDNIADASLTATAPLTSPTALDTRWTFANSGSISAWSVTGTNEPAQDAAINAPVGTGTGVAAALVFKAGTPQNSGTTAHPLVTILTLKDSGSAGTSAPVAIFAAGTVAAPSITGVGALTSGLFFPTNAVSLSVNAAQQLALTANSTRIGPGDAATAAAQAITVPNVVAGTTNVAGADTTLNGSQGTGTGAGGKWVFKAAGAGNTGTAQNAENTIVTLQDSGTAATSAPQMLAGAVGTAGLPFYSFGASTTAGMYSASGNIRFAIGGVLATEIQAANVVIFNDSGAFFAGSSADVQWKRRGAANWQMGAADSAAPVAQTISMQSVVAGTSNTAGVNTTLVPSLGTGLGAGSQYTIDRAIMLGTGTTQQSAAHAFAICESKTLSNTSATAQTIANINLASNSAGGLDAHITVTASDGTNFDSETQNVTVSYVNKAGTITVGTPAISASTAANNSGSATIGATVTGATPTISLKVTPVFTTIVPTTVTVYAEIFSHGPASTVTCQ